MQIPRKKIRGKEQEEVTLDSLSFKSEKQSRIVIDTKRRWLDERNTNLQTEEYLRTL